MRMRVAVVCLVSIGFAGVHAQQPRPVRGRVVDAATGAPVARARISEVAAPGDIPDLEPVMTDERGEFQLAAAPAVIEVFKAGYARTNVPTDTVTGRLDIRVLHGAAIAGRVVDRAGAPVSQLLAGVFEIAGAIEAKAPVGRVTTNDLGEYRVGDLKPGRYRVRFGLDEAVQSTAIDVRAGDEIEVMPVTVPVTCPDPKPTSSTILGKAVLRGRVTTTANVPLACVRVTVRGNGSIREANTDAQGRYAVVDLSPGSYAVTAARAGYTVLQYGQERVGQDGKVVRVDEVRPANDINIALPRGSAIAGMITDDAGDPVEGAQVQVLKLSMVEGRQAALPPQGARSQRSDDRGRYRVYGLLPGRYLVSAAAPGNAVSVNVAPGGQLIVETNVVGGTATTPILFPGTTDPALAALLTIEQGRELDGIDVSLRRFPAVNVTGSAFDSDGRPARGGVLLAISQRSGGIMLEPRTTRVASNGSFTFRSVPPGDYVVQTIAPRPGSAPDFAAEYVRVGDEDPPPVVLRTSPGPILEGRIVKDGPDDPANRFLVMPFPVDFDRSPLIGTGPAGITVQPDGTYRAAGMNGVRRMVLSAPDGWYLKSVTLKGLDITDDAYDFGQRPAVFSDLQIVVSHAGATIDGDVRDRGTPVDTYSVVLFSTDRSRWFRNSRHLKVSRPGPDGRFRITGIVPGDYFLAAVDVLDGVAEAGEWQDPVVLESLTRDAAHLSLGEYQQITRSLALQHR